MRKLTDFGAFLEIEEGVDGLVHVSDLSWTKHVKHPSEVLKKGQVMQAVILNIDAPNRRLSLGREAASAGRLGELLPLARSRRSGARPRVPRRGVRRVRGIGAGSGGAVPQVRDSGHAGSRRRRATRLLPIGDEYDFKIIKMNEAEKKIGLSLRAVAEEEERTRLEDYQRQAAAATMTIEEAMNIRGKGEGR